MLIITQYITKHELKPLQKHFNIGDIIEGARKVIQGLGQRVNVSRQNNSFRFFKVPIGNKPKGRMIVFILAEKNKVVPLLIRLKKDKKIGMNMSAQNQFVVNLIDKNLGHVIEDIKKGDFEEFEL